MVLRQNLKDLQTFTYFNQGKLFENTPQFSKCAQKQVVAIHYEAIQLVRDTFRGEGGGYPKYHVVT